MAHRVSVVLLLFSLFWIDAADAQRAPRDQRSWLLSVNHGQMTADIDLIPLRLVLQELGRTCHCDCRWTTRRAIIL